MVNPIEWYPDDSEFEDELNEIFGEVTICGYKYGQGTVLRELDPIAFNCMVIDSKRYQCDDCGCLFEDFDECNECCGDDEN